MPGVQILLFPDGPRGGGVQKVYKGLRDGVPSVGVVQSIFCAVRKAGFLSILSKIRKSGCPINVMFYRSPRVVSHIEVYYPEVTSSDMCSTAVR